MMNLSYDKSKVTWEFEGKKYEYFIYNIFRATIKNNYIFIESNNIREEKEIFTYVTFKGLLIASIEYNAKNDLSYITISDERNKKFKLAILNRGDVVANDKHIYAISGKPKEEKIIKLSLHGKTIREYPLPENYSAERFFSLIDDDKEIKVILNGEEEKGSWQWCFVLNTETGIWERRQSIDGH